MCVWVTIAWGESVSLGTLEVPPPDGPGPRKLMIVHGVALSGTLEARYEHGGATLNGVTYLGVPRPMGIMVPRGRFDPSGLSSRARKQFEQVPRVVRHLREGWSSDSSIVEYWTASESLLVLVPRIYRDALPHGQAEADRLARAAIDPELAYPDSAGPHAARFAANGSISMYFVNFGAREVSVTEGPTPTPKEQATWLRTRAEGQLDQFRMFLSIDVPVLIVCTEGAVMTLTGKDATEAFAEIERLKAARTKHERDSVTVVHLLKSAVREMEEAGFFDAR